MNGKFRQRALAWSVLSLAWSILQAAFVEHVAKLVNGGSITGVSDVRDESDREGMRVVLELRKGINADVIINNLYKQTALQTTFPCNMVALVDATPQTLNLKQFLQHFLDFRSVMLSTVWSRCVLCLLSIVPAVRCACYTLCLLSIVPATRCACCDIRYKLVLPQVLL